MVCKGYGLEAGEMNRKLHARREEKNSKSKKKQKFFIWKQGNKAKSKKTEAGVAVAIP